MDEFFPENEYNPEDEYAPIDNTPPNDFDLEIDDDDIPVIEPPTQNVLPQNDAEGQPYQQFEQPYEQQPYYGYASQYDKPQPQQGYAPQYDRPQPQQGYAPQYDRPQPYRQPAQPYVQQTGRPAQYNGNPYANGGYNQPRQQQPGVQVSSQKPPTSTGTKAFIIILCALLAAMLIGFITYVSITANNKNNNNSNNGGFSIDNGHNDEGDNNGGFDIFGGNNATGFTEVEDEITLIEDKGETQKRDDDNPESVCTPDEKAESIKLVEQPKDKDDDKYTKQGAYEAVSDSVVTVVCYKDKVTDNDKDIVAQGTGTIISSDGYIVTNAHVISNSKMFAVNIVTNHNDKYQAKIVGYDTWTDLAVLKIDAKDLKPVVFGDSDLVNVGDEVITIGSPGGVKFQNSLTQGIVSAVDRELSINRYVRYIQSDAAISPGNSGGPLCNIYGQVIGITTAKSVAEYYENMTFSIPSRTVEEVVNDLMRYGYVKGRTRIGFTGQAVSDADIYYYNYPQGIIISDIDENGALAGTDLKDGDVITQIDGEDVTSFQDIYNVLANHKPGDKVKIKVSRPKN